MRVFEPGSEVKISDLTVKVIEVLIKRFHIQYKIVYWSGRERKEVWVEDYEVSPITDTRSKRLSIGFHNEP